MTKALAYGECSCDEICCWVRKEYSVRNYYRVCAMGDWGMRKNSRALV